MIQAPFALAYRHHVDKCLCRVIVTAVARIYNRYARVYRGAKRCSLLWMAHSYDIGVAAYYTRSVSDGFTLGGAGLPGSGEAQGLTAEV